MMIKSARLVTILKNDWVRRLFSVAVLSISGLLVLYAGLYNPERPFPFIVVAFVGLFVSGAILSSDDIKAVKGDVADAIDGVGRLFRTVGGCFLVLLVIALGFGALWLLIRLIRWMWEKPLPTL